MLTPHRVAGFVNARSWLKDVREHADPHLTCILVGNKVDLCSDSDDGPDDADTAEGASARPKRKKREVPTEEAEIWALEEGLLFVEASAKSGVNVEAARLGISGRGGGGNRDRGESPDAPVNELSGRLGRARRGQR